jgi:hypothetical protein
MTSLRAFRRARHQRPLLDVIPGAVIPMIAAQPHQSGLLAAYQSGWWGAALDVPAM